jgi:hypothetical protein
MITSEAAAQPGFANDRGMSLLLVMRVIIHASCRLVYDGMVELTLFLRRRYARLMMQRMTVSVLLLLTCLAVPGFLPAKERPAKSVIPEDDYGLYNEVVAKKFLTSQTQLVVIERMTVSRLLPNQKTPPPIALFDEQGYFNDALPMDLVRDFVGVNQEPGRLEERFHFGVRYRLVSNNLAEEEPEVTSGLPVKVRPAGPAGAPSVVDRLAFSRVGRTLRNDQALLYVEHVRPDGTGAGFLVWFRRPRLEWTIADTDVVWTASDEDSEEAP